jgi:hypothetical protein
MFGFGFGLAVTRISTGSFRHENQIENRPPRRHRQPLRPEPVSFAGGDGEEEGDGED